MEIPNDDICGKCPFFATRNNRFVPPPEAGKYRIAIVGMNPGQTELEQGKYFVGMAGNNLDIGLKLIDIPREEIYITNAVKCYTVPKVENIRATHIKYCREYLDYELFLVDPELIVVAGDIALQAVTGLKGITSKIKKLLWSEHYRKPVIAILHPAAILHNAKNRGLYLESIAYIKRFLEDELTSTEDFGEYHVIRTKNEIDEVIRNCKAANFCCMDIENNEKKPYDPDCILRCVSLAYKPRLSYCIPYTELPEDLKSFAAKAISYLITSKDIDILGHYTWFDLQHFTIPMKIVPQGNIWDTMLEHCLLDVNSSHGLKQLVWEFTKMGGYEKIVEDQGGPGKCPIGPDLYRYNNIDTDGTFRLHNLFMPRLEVQGLMRPYRNILMPAAEVLAEIETRGVVLDRRYGEDLKIKAEQMLPEIVNSIREVPQVAQFEKDNATTFNPSSPLQIRKVLFNYMRLPVLRTTTQKTEPSTDAKALEMLEEQYGSKICKLILDYRLVQGLYSKYLGKLQELADANSRIHTSYLLHVARSGRTSSANPNLQNLPKRGKDVLDVKNCFIPSPGNWLLEGDFNQHEYRVVAGVSGDVLMKKLFQEDRIQYEKALAGVISWKSYKEHALDMHRANASEVFGVPYAEVTSEQRRAAKGLSFGVLYGMGGDKLSEILKCSNEQAERYLHEYYRKFSGIKSWKDRETEALYLHKYITTCTGRRRQFPIVDGDAVREGINTLIQGPASDFMLISLIRINKLLKSNCLRSLLYAQVHDSITVDLVPAELPEVIEILREVMDTSAKEYIDIPLQVDFSIGLRWGSLIDLIEWEGNGRRFL